MRIISEQKCGAMIAKNLSQYPEAEKMPPYDIVIKLRFSITMAILLLSSVLAIVTFKNYKNDILSYFQMETLTAFDRIYIAFIGFMIITITIILMTVIHEFLHCVLNLNELKSCYIVFTKPITISVYYDKWNTKVKELLSLILPFAFFQVIALLFYIISQNIFFLLWISLINLACSSSDIISFVVTISKAPKDSLILGHYFRHQ